MASFLDLDEPVVEVVNRVRDKEGKVVPCYIYYGGGSKRVEEHIFLPLSIARVVIHNSMYKLEPDTWFASFRLGCKELGLPTEPISENEVNRLELVDRGFLGPDRQFGAVDRHGRKLTPVVHPQHMQRRDPIQQIDPGSGDGVLPGSFGEPKKPA